MFDQLINYTQELAKRKDFKPFADMSAMQVVPPLRKHKKAVYSILARVEGISDEERLQNMQLAGITKDGDNEIELIPMNKALEELALVLFDIDAEDVKDFDNLNEGEVNAGKNFFFMKLNGI